MVGGYRLGIVTDASEVGGAEVILHTIISSLPNTVESVVMGPDRRTLGYVASARPDSTVRLVDGGVRDWVRAYRSTDVDVLHVNLGSFAQCRTALIAAIVSRTPYIVVDHAPTSGLRRRGRAWQRAMTAASSARVAVSAEAARRVSELGSVPRHRITVVPNGIPSYPLPERPTHEGPFRFGTLCRLVPLKGVDVLLDALAQLGGTATLEIAGSGEAMTELQRQTARLHLDDRVTFRGWTDRSREFLASLDGFVLASRDESVGLSILEAMQVGTPVIATEVGGVPEIASDGATALLVRPDDPAGLAAAMNRLMHDPELRRRLAYAARDVVARERSGTAMASAYDNLYRRAISRRGRLRA